MTRQPLSKSAPLRIAFDQQIFRRQPRGGISRYFRDLSSGLEYDPSVMLMQPSRAQIVHATFYSGRPYRLKSGQSLVSSLFDFTPERHPEHFFLPQLRSPHGNKCDWLEASDLILSISKASADDLCFFRPGLSAALRIIHLSTQIGSVQPIAIEKLQQRRFWLMVGKRYAYKNGLTLLRALQRLGESPDPPLLVCAGGGPWSKQELRWISSNNLGQKVLQLSADDQQLSWLYRQAEAVLVPSIAEGFSLPLIEALAWNTPVIASDIEAHREVAGSYAALLPALNADAWAEVLKEAVDQPMPSPRQILGTDNYKNLLSYYGQERMVNDHICAYRILI